MNCGPLKVKRYDEAMEVRPRVLCVDDEPRVLVGLSRQLSRRFDVVTCPDPKEAMALVEAEEFSVVISDLKMPHVDGIEFLRHVQEISPNTTRLILTAYGEFVQLTTALANQLVFRVLQKPCSTGDLLAAVEQAVHKHDHLHL